MPRAEERLRRVEITRCRPSSRGAGGCGYINASARKYELLRAWVTGLRLDRASTLRIGSNVAIGYMFTAEGRWGTVLSSVDRDCNLAMRR